MAMGVKSNVLRNISRSLSSGEEFVFSQRASGLLFSLAISVLPSCAAFLAPPHPPQVFPLPSGPAPPYLIRN